MTADTNTPRFIEPLRLDRGAVAAATAAVASLGGFIVLAVAIVAGWSPAFDERLLLACRKPGATSELIGPAWWLTAARLVTNVGNGLTLLLAAVVAIVWVVRRSPRGDTLAGWWIAATGLTGFAVQEWLKLGIGRARPAIVERFEHVATRSFPSGHATMSAVVYLAVAIAASKAMPTRAGRVAVLAGGGLLAVLVGCSRVVLGVHYPTDVLGGWLLGLGWVMLGLLVARGVRQRQQTR